MSVEYAIKEYEKTGTWGPKKDLTTSKAPKRPKGDKRLQKLDDEDDGMPDGGDASEKPQGKTKRRPRDDDEE
ncbi:MAG: hypothetical protein ASARMPRED_002453 [Alectoria sarmentosa]|nr:MAG: hypothetical protein ASARMPRED_002453 [Alectoria sarmentosa]